MLFMQNLYKSKNKTSQIRLEKSFVSPSMWISSITTRPISLSLFSTTRLLKSACAFSIVHTYSERLCRRFCGGNLQQLHRWIKASLLQVKTDLFRLLKSACAFSIVHTYSERLCRRFCGGNLQQLQRLIKASPLQVKTDLFRLLKSACARVQWFSQLNGIHQQKVAK